MSSSGNTKVVALNWSWELILVLFGVLTLGEQGGQMGAGVTWIGWIACFFIKGEIGFLPHNKGKEGHIWSLEHPCLLLLPCPVAKINGKPQESL